jgi:RHS repeat-associated protein
MAILTSCAFAEMPAKLPEFMNPEQLAKWRAETAAENAAKARSAPSKPDVQSSNPDVPTPFFTGKPYIESTGTYAFKYRSYNPELARWTSEDPSGFPDGANQSAYAPIPTCEFDYEGLKAHLAFDDQSHSIALSVYVYDATNSFTNYSMSAWKAAVESAWTFSGTDVSNQLCLSLGASITFTLQSGGVFNSDWSSLYDNAVVFTSAVNAISSVYNNNYGVWRTDIVDSTVVHEVGHFMKADDHYTVSYVSGVRTTTPNDGWQGSIMGAGSTSAIKKDANEVLKNLGENIHLFE